MTHVKRRTGAVQYSERIDAVIYKARPLWTTVELLELALAALDQAGVTEQTQEAVKSRCWTELDDGSHGAAVDKRIAEAKSDLRELNAKDRELREELRRYTGRIYDGYPL